MQITNVKCPSSKYSIKCPYTMKPQGIAVHNTANNASAMSEISYMIGNNNKVSFHAAVDDYRIVTGIPFDRNTWHCGDGTNGKGNRNYIAIEICYSKSGGERFTKAEKLAAKYIAYLLKQYGWGIEKVKKHQDFNGKYCPHRTLDLGWQRFLNMIKAELGDTTKPTTKDTTVLEWQKVMNKLYKCGLAEDNSFGPDSEAKADKYYLYYEKGEKVIVNDHVKFIQNRLIAKGYSCGKSGADKSYGPDTRDATKAFQKANGLEVDGWVGAKTTKLLLK